MCEQKGVRGLISITRETRVPFRLLSNVREPSNSEEGGEILLFDGETTKSLKDQHRSITIPQRVITVIKTKSYFNNRIRTLMG